MRALLLIFMTAILLAGFALGDKIPFLNAYELARASGMAFLPESGTRYLADQAMFGKAAIAVAWALWVAASAFLAAITIRLWNILR